MFIRILFVLTKYREMYSYSRYCVFVDGARYSNNLFPMNSEAFHLLYIYKYWIWNGFGELST